ncbi:MAG: hypothetical protein V2A55_00050 [Candidatus Jorgensenbacteria bacterium]
MFFPGGSRPVYCYSCWWSDKWDPMDFSRSLDFNRPLFEQFRDLIAAVPVIALWGYDNTNSEYSNHSAHCKNYYLSFSGTNDEDVYYSYGADDCKNIFDCFLVANSENIYECVDAKKSYNSTFLIKCRECLDSHFLFDCVNCKNCFLSHNLRGKQYYIRNKPLTKDEYFRELVRIDFGSHLAQKKIYEDFVDLIKNSLHKYAAVVKSSDCTGDDISNSQNVKNSYLVHNSQDSKHCWRLVKQMKNAHDICGGLVSELVYEGVIAGQDNYLVSFYSQFKDSRESFYCISGSGNSHLFGCVGLRNKQYCILNKQYTKEEYESLIPRIIKHMDDMPYVDKKGRVYRYGEFFPPELSPFAYNETIAEEYFPLSKEEAISQGYRWKDPETKEYKVTKRLEDLSDHINDVDDSILKETIGCAHAIGSPSENSGQIGKPICNEQCTTAFKIIKDELQFYRKMNLPLPRLCPNCRHYQRLKQRNPLKLWHRTCRCAGGKSENSIYSNTAKHFHESNHCPNEFETSYSPERKEIVYCESCYNSEVV